MDNKLEWIAQNLLFGKNIKISESLEYIGLEYRKGKDEEDIKKARSKALKNGMNKTEFELNMLQVYLKTVLKNSKVNIKNE